LPTFCCATPRLYNAVAARSDDGYLVTTLA
jgi:hypothetical protein